MCVQFMHLVQIITIINYFRVKCCTHFINWNSLLILLLGAGTKWTWAVLLMFQRTILQHCQPLSTWFQHPKAGSTLTTSYCESFKSVTATLCLFSTMLIKSKPELRFIWNIIIQLYTSFTLSCVQLTCDNMFRVINPS